MTDCGPLDEDTRETLFRVPDDRDRERTVEDIESQADVSAIGTTTGGGNSGDAEIVIYEIAPEPPSNLAASASGEGSIGLTWDLSPDDGDIEGYRIYRSTEPGVDRTDTQVADVAAGTSSHEDSGLLDGNTYYYAIESYYSTSASSLVGDASAVTPMPSPTGFSVDSVTGRKAALSWTEASNNTDHYEIHVKKDSDTSYIVDGTTSGVGEGQTATYETTALLDGQKYQTKVAAKTTDASASAGPLSFTTDLPDASGLSLDASVTNEFTAFWDDVLNNGEYRIEVRDDDPDGNHPDYQHEATIAFDAGTEHTIENLLDGEKYSVRIRSQTAFVTGNWLTANDITKLIAPTLDALTPSTDAVDLSWTNNHDSIDGGSIQIYRNRSDYDIDGKGPLIDTVATTSNTYTDSPLPPDREFSYTIRLLTQWVFADSDTQTVTTESAGLVQSSAPPIGWHAELDHPSGTTLTPRILDDVSFQPMVTALPEANVPVPQDSSWFGDALEGAPMHVWTDGDRLPIDELEDVEDGTSETTLVGVGGTQLERRVQEDVLAEPAHELAERLIAEHTDYTTQIDAPETVQSTDVVRSIPDDVWEDALSIGPDQPFEVVDGTLQTLQTCFTQTAFDRSDESNSEIHTNRDAFVRGQVRGIGAIDAYVEWEATTQHRIPAEHVAVPCCIADTTDAFGAKLKLQFGGSSYQLYTFSDGQGINVSQDEIVWFDMADDPFGDGAGYDGPDIPAGTTVTLRLDDWGTDGTFTGFTAVAPVADARYHDVDTFDEQVHEPQGHLDTPGYYPTAAEIRLERILTVLSVYGGDLSVTMDDTSGEQAIAISNDGVNWIEAQNATSVSGEFADRSSELLVRLTLARHGTQDVTPRTGIEPQRVSALDLEVWLDDTPLIADRNLSGDLIDVLETIGADADYLFEVRQDGDQTTVHGAQPGQRSGATELEISDYSVTKHSKRVLKAIVKGGAQRVEDETVTVTDGEAALEGTDVVSGSQTVRSEDGSVTYRRSFDYELRTGAGVLEIREGGNIDDEETLTVSYQHKPSGSWEHPDWAGDARTAIEEDIPAATSERACERAAKILVDEASEPRYEATVSLPARADAGGLLEALDLDRMPGGPMSVYEVTAAPDGQELTLGSRKRVRERVQQIQSQLAETSDRV